MRKFLSPGFLVVLGLFSLPALAAPGEYWEVTNKMEMQGMSMPGMTQRVCMGKGGEKDPRNSTDKDCEMTDVKSSGSKTSWKMRCNKNGEVMTGTGEMSATADRTEGNMTFTSNKTGTMSMSFVNKRVGGACDTEEMKKKLDAMQDSANKQMAAQQAQICDMYKRNLGRDVQSYFGLKNSPETVKSCGFDMGAAKASLCKSVDANNADFNKQMRGDAKNYSKNLQAECPREMKTYAEVSRKRYCEGRAFTEKQRVSLADCLKGTSESDEAMNNADPDEPPMPSNSSTNASSAAKKAAAQAAKNDAANAEQNKQDAGSAAKTPGGVNIPGMPNNADALIDGAKKLKNLFGL